MSSEKTPLSSRFGSFLGRHKKPLIYFAACAVLLLSLRERTWQHLATLNDEEWQPVQTFVRAHRQGPEPICFLPSWTRGHAVDQYKFRGIDQLEDPAEAWQGQDEPLPGFWVVSQFGAFDPDDVPEDIYPHREHRTLGAADIFVFRREPFTLPESRVNHLRSAHCVVHDAKGRRVELEWYRHGHVIPRSHPLSKSLSYVGCRPEQGRFAGRHKTGIWFHPPRPPNSLSITWARVPLEQWLVVAGGLRDKVARGNGASVQLQVILNGKTLDTIDFPSKRGWMTHELPTSGQGESGRLSFKVSTKNSHSRHFIFDAWTTSERPRASSRPSRGVRAKASAPPRAPTKRRADQDASDDGGPEPSRDDSNR